MPTIIRNVSLSFFDIVRFSEQRWQATPCPPNTPAAIINPGRTARPPSGDGRTNHNMDDAGQKLRQAREARGLRVRDVQEASERIAQKHGNDKFGLVINSISEIENRGVIPSFYKLYSLAAIYRLDFDEVLSWYGVNKSELIPD